MRKPLYLSPSALGVYESNPEEYYIRYLASYQPMPFPQTHQMAAGSAFDAYIKSYLHEKIYGKGHPESDKYELRTLFESQVESAQRDAAWPLGAYLFDCYKQSGALADLMLELAGAVSEPRFEFKVSGVVDGMREGLSGKILRIPLVGKPDIYFVNAEGASVILDWKCNGIYARNNSSPSFGYIEIRESFGGSWIRRGCHRDVTVTKLFGLRASTQYLESTSLDWATQLSTYGWLLGIPIGVEFVCGIDQFAGNGLKRVTWDSKYDYATVRIASHRARISSEFQRLVHKRYSHLWSLINSEPLHFFRELSLVDSQKKQEELDARSVMYRDPTLTEDEKALLMWSRY